MDLVRITPGLVIGGADNQQMFITPLPRQLPRTKQEFSDLVFKHSNKILYVQEFGDVEISKEKKEVVGVFPKYTEYRVSKKSIPADLEATIYVTSNEWNTYENYLVKGTLLAVGIQELDDEGNTIIKIGFASQLGKVVLANVGKDDFLVVKLSCIVVGELLNLKDIEDPDEPFKPVNPEVDKAYVKVNYLGDAQDYVLDVFAQGPTTINMLLPGVYEVQPNTPYTVMIGGSSYTEDQHDGNPGMFVVTVQDYNVKAQEGLIFNEELTFEAGMITELNIGHRLAEDKTVTLEGVTTENGFNLEKGTATEVTGYEGEETQITVVTLPGKVIRSVTDNTGNTLWSGYTASITLTVQLNNQTLYFETQEVSADPLPVELYLGEHVQEAYFNFEVTGTQKVTASELTDYETPIMCNVQNGDILNSVDVVTESGYASNLTFIENDGEEMPLMGLCNPTKIFVRATEGYTLTFKAAEGSGLTGNIVPASTEGITPDISESGSQVFYLDKPYALEAAVVMAVIKFRTEDRTWVNLWFTPEKEYEGISFRVDNYGVFTFDNVKEDIVLIVSGDKNI